MELLAYNEIVDVIRTKRERLGVDRATLAQRARIPLEQLEGIEDNLDDAPYRTIYDLMETLTIMKKEQTLTARDVMTRNVYWIDADKTVEEAKKIMYNNDYLQLPVKEEREDGTYYNIGSFTEIQLRDVDNMDKTVGQTMGPPFPEIDPGTGYQQINQMFIQGHSAALVVENGSYTGIVTRTDLQS